MVVHTATLAGVSMMSLFRFGHKVNTPETHVAIYPHEIPAQESKAKDGMHRALEQLRLYYEREDFAIPESISVELGFCTIHIHNPQVDFAQIMAYFALWVEKIQWERESVKQFLTNWLRGPAPAGISISFNYINANGVGIAAEYSGNAILLCIEYILTDLELE